MEEAYPDEFGKMALALTSAQIAKSGFVKDFGVGEDLAFNFIGWRNGKIKIITQLNKSFMTENPISRLGRCTDMCRTVKAYWDIDSISMIAEGYCSEDLAKTKGLDLAKAFATNDGKVYECLTVTHVESAYEEDPLLTLVSMGYQYRKGNNVHFDEAKVYPQGAINVLRDKSYPAMLYKTIYNSYVSEDDNEEDVVDKLVSMGFHVQVID